MTIAHAGFSHLAEEWERAATTDPRHAISPAVDYDASGMHRADEVASLITPDQATTLLELGCGDGRVTQWLVELGYGRVIAADISPTMLALVAARNLVDVETVLTDGTDLHVHADAIYTDSVLMHNRHADVAKILVALRGCVEVGAPFALHLPVYADGGTEPGDWTAVGTWSPDELRSDADAAGWDVASMEVSPGRFDFARPGPAHSAMHLLVAN